MFHGITGLVHTIAAFASLLIGAWIFLRPKAGKLHRSFGYAYTAAMSIMIVTAFFIYQLTGTVNFLHILAVVSTLTLARALYCAIRKRPAGRWLEVHYEWMSWSYIGLFAAFIAETATRVALPYLFQHFGQRAIGWFWGIVILVIAGSC